MLIFFFFLQFPTLNATDLNPFGTLYFLILSKLERKKKDLTSIHLLMCCQKSKCAKSKDTTSN